MSESKRNSDHSWVDPDDAPEWAEEVWERAEIAVGGKVLRRARGTLTRPGRPPERGVAKQQVTLRLDPDVIARFRDGGPGWQTRMNSALRKAAGI